MSPPINEAGGNLHLDDDTISVSALTSEGKDRLAVSLGQFLMSCRDEVEINDISILKHHVQEFNYQVLLDLTASVHFLHRSTF